MNSNTMYSDSFSKSFDFVFKIKKMCYIIGVLENVWTATRMFIFFVSYCLFGCFVFTDLLAVYV